MSYFGVWSLLHFVHVPNTIPPRFSSLLILQLRGRGPSSGHVLLASDWSIPANPHRGSLSATPLLFPHLKWGKLQLQILNCFAFKEIFASCLASVWHAIPINQCLFRHYALMEDERVPQTTECGQRKIHAKQRRSNALFETLSFDMVWILILKLTGDYNERESE